MPILFVAPTGCGKELLAQHIHQWSRRRGELVDINCAALPEHLIESELFGHDGQAYTGARRAKPGLIEVASGGTLFLDEVGSLPPALQPKLLRVLETGGLRRVGETVKRRIDIRILAAAQDDLLGRWGEGGFRRDLYQRLAGMVLAVPRLAERPEDIVALARYFAGLGGRDLQTDAEVVLLRYDWPGNARELRQVIERAGWLVEGALLPAASIAEAIELGAPPETAVADRDAELARTCADCGWEAKRIMAVLGIRRTTLYYRLRAAGLSLREGRRSLRTHQSLTNVHERLNKSDSS